MLNLLCFWLRVAEYLRHHAVTGRLRPRWFGFGSVV